MRVLNKIIQDRNEPLNKQDVWIKPDMSINIFNNGNWENISRPVIVEPLEVTATAVEADEAGAEVETTENTARFTFSIPRGPKGDRGNNGDDAVIYWLVPAATKVVVPKESVTAVPSSIAIKAYKRIGNNDPIDITSTATIKWGYNTDSPTNTAKGISSINPNYNYITVHLIVDGIVVDKQTIAIIKEGKDGSNGTNGTNGVSTKILYTKTSSADVVPTFNQTSTNPGSSWGSVIPSITSNEVIWAIQTYIDYTGALKTNWEGPILMSGIKGKDAVAPNYKVYVYKVSETKPSAPTGTSVSPSGWSDYPNTTGQWWQCIGTVNGITGQVVSWSEVLPVNGQNGTAQDGKKTEFRFAKNTSSITAPTITNNIRNAGGWSLTPIALSEGEFLWITTAVINPDDTLNGTWSTPVRISGEQGQKGDKGDQGDQGPQGPQGIQGEIGPTGPEGQIGPQGVSGIPGTSFVVQYCIGTETQYTSTWSSSVPTTTTAYPYIWCRQGRRVYSSAEDTTGTVTYGTPFKLSGTNGLNGNPGKRGQLVYPAGVYDNTKRYVTDDYKAPYVLDTLDGNYYILNASEWDASIQTLTPSQSYAVNGGTYWQLAEWFDAIFAKVGIIANGLIGSAVFNGDYMFSQQGTTTIDGTVSGNYENFNPDDPFGDGNSFYPNICFNFKTGAIWIGKNKFTVDQDGNCSIGSLQLLSNSIIIPSTNGKEIVIDGRNASIYCRDVNNSSTKYWQLFSHGKMVCANGKVNFNADGSGKIGDLVTWDGELENITFLNGDFTYNKTHRNIINKRLNSEDITEFLASSIDSTNEIETYVLRQGHSKYMLYSHIYWDSATLGGFSSLQFKLPNVVKLEGQEFSISVSKFTSKTVVMKLTVTDTDGNDMKFVIPGAGMNGSIGTTNFLVLDPNYIYNFSTFSFEGEISLILTGKYPANPYVAN